MSIRNVNIHMNAHAKKVDGGIPVKRLLPINP